MGMYYGDEKELTGFTEESLKEEICAVFSCGVVAFKLSGRCTDLTNARHKCLTEILEHMVTWSFPNLDELKSGGPLQEYVRLLREQRK